MVAFSSAKFEPCPVGWVPNGFWRAQSAVFDLLQETCMLKISASEVAFFSLLGVFALITIKKIFC